ncbi:hypothetical protein IU449_04745 [Nocardia higoensis]|uniref:Uncharacterized protein n=1 Tax=Nocardia higoensis TaxID=228599 RepID=A0ABS0D5V5_9NOCA|nr:hypothetical protein [Nocardia higoensis]MBF6353862.1 hypothetical protein [Nocardia higoensis]
MNSLFAHIPATRLRIDATSMTSEVSPERAARESRAGPRCWRLSWLPDRWLSRRQALAGMELDVLVSEPDLVDDRIVFAMMETRADLLGIPVQDALIRIWERIVRRHHERYGPPGPDVREWLELPPDFDTGSNRRVFPEHA